MAPYLFNSGNHLPDDFEDAIEDDFDYNDEFDEDDLIASANAEALAHDRSFYAQEFWQIIPAELDVERPLCLAALPLNHEFRSYGISPTTLLEETPGSKSRAIQAYYVWEEEIQTRAQLYLKSCLACQEVDREEERKLWQIADFCPISREFGKAFLRGKLRVLEGPPERAVQYEALQREVSLPPLGGLVWVVDLEERHPFCCERESTPEVELWPKGRDEIRGLRKPIVEVIRTAEMELSGNASFTMAPPTPTPINNPHSAINSDNGISRQLSRHVTGPRSRWELRISSSTRGFGALSSPILRKDAVEEAQKIELAGLENGGKIARGHSRIGVPKGLAAACTSQTGQWS